MDMFMDKLAQKLTAQEIIRANTTAETEELNRLRNQVAEYNDCLERLQKLIEEGAEKLQGPQVDGGELNRLVEESIHKIQSLQQDNAGLEELTEQLTDRMDTMDRKMGERLISVSRSMDERFESVDSSMEEKLSDIDRSLDEKLSGIDRLLDEKLGGMDRSLEAKLSGVDRMLSEKIDQLNTQEDEADDGNLEERFNSLNENVHRECVKVYRNVQAVVVEEGEKQSSAISDATIGVRGMGDKLGKIFTISTAALVFSLLSFVLQILRMIGVF